MWPTQQTEAVVTFEGVSVHMPGATLNLKHNLSDVKNNLLDFALLNMHPRLWFHMNK
jgi:hypothetical protein